MIIYTDPENFYPKNFAILNFYGEDMCFAWRKNEFICFPYSIKNLTKTTKVLKAPKKIKDFRSYKERIFILCSPSGIYKFTENWEFAILSKSGIELGANFSEVFTLSNDMLVLEDKKHKSIRKIISATSTNDLLYVLPLNNNDVDEMLCRILFDDTSNVNLCIFAYGKKLFKMYDQITKIIYSCDNLIKKIKPVEKFGKIAGLILQTDKNILIFMHVKKNKLYYDKIFLNVDVKNVCGSINSNDKLLLVYSDNTNTYYTRRNINENLNKEIRTEETYYENFIIYQSKFIVYLKPSKELFQINVDYLNNLLNEQSPGDFIKLAQNMLNGINNIVEVITDKTSELYEFHKKMIEKEDRLKRINIFINKQHLVYCSEDTVQRLLNQIFLISNFKDVLPVSTVIVKMLKHKGKSIFAMKRVEDKHTIVQMPITIPNLTSALYFTTDLITYKNDEGIWCLIKNYLRDPLPSKNNQIHLTPEQHRFVKHKLLVLKTMMTENNVNLESLSKLKKEIRNEIKI